MTISQETLRAIISYDAETGDFRWLLSKGRAQAGSLAGAIDTQGYRLIGLNGRLYRAHRLAWFWTYGEWPTKHLDHINGDPLDNRLANLREATDAENNCNRGPTKKNKAGIKGVWWRYDRSKWCAQIRVNGKSRHLGHFDSAEDAHAAYVSAAKVLHGKFWRAA